MSGINMMPIFQNNAQKISAEEMQKRADDFIHRERGDDDTVSDGQIARSRGTFLFKPYLIPEDDFYCAYSASGLLCPPFVAVAAFQKSKLRPDQVAFMERKCRKTEEDEKKR